MAGNYTYSPEKKFNAIYFRYREHKLLLCRRLLN